MAQQPINTPQNENPNIRKLFIFIGVVVAICAIWAIVGGLFTNSPTGTKGVGAVTDKDSAFVQESDTLRTQ
ncbi:MULTISPECIES: hypothetical protein [Siphonobacter]|uniref:Uncharacterized protein n=1 Tax=Siphonobacter curvatus TaxID=2094562 RepID=A0A2S7IIR4_9BACT|nr:hypothetical protein [Siphonobacter curvatus]PQA56166.1 hypothetical protein C5O19_17585 [Siphonobacter curvatus]